MAQSTGTNIDKTGIVNDFESVVRSVAAAGIQIQAGGQPERATLNEGRAGHGGGNWADSHTVTGGHPDSQFSTGVPAGPVESNLTDPITGAQLGGVIRDFAYNLTRIRKTMFKITSGNGAAYEYVDGPFITNLSDSFRTQYTELNQAATDYQIATQYIVKASTLNNYLIRIKDIYNQARNSTAAVNNCHSNCHSNCHGSRNRR